jgi:hypothetical protein
LVGDAGTGDVVLTADTAATVTETDGWEYLEDGVVTSVSPANGQRSTTVIIAGERLRGGGASVDSVTLGGVEVATIEGESDTEVVVAAARADATDAAVDVLLTANTGAVVTAEGAWTYLTEGEITVVRPSSGQLGTRVVIEGTGLFGGGADVDLASLAGNSVELVSANDTIVIVTIVDSTAGSGDATLVSDSGAVVSLADAFERIEDGDITVVSPGRGQLGTVVAIHGNNLFGGGARLKSITFGGVEPLQLIEAGNTYIQVRVAESDAGVGDIVIISNTGSVVQLSNGWTYDVPSDITEVCV